MASHRIEASQKIVSHSISERSNSDKNSTANPDKKRSKTLSEPLSEINNMLHKSVASLLPQARLVAHTLLALDNEGELPAKMDVFYAWYLGLCVIRRESWVNDTQSGCPTYNQGAIRSLYDDDTVGGGMSASIDVLYHAHQHDYDLEEIGTTIDYTTENLSNHSPITHGLTLVANILRTIEHDRPVTSLGVPGFLNAFAGLGFGYWTFSNYISTGMFPLELER